MDSLDGHRLREHDLREGPVVVDVFPPAEVLVMLSRMFGSVVVVAVA